MSVDVAYPVFRTDDPASALRVARQLLALGVQQYSRVRVDVELRTVEDVLHARKVLPDARFRREDFEDWICDPDDPTAPSGSIHTPELSTDPAFLSAQLPLWAEMWNQPVESIEDRFTAFAARHVAEINWDLLGWPEVPEAGLYADFKHAEVSVLFNAATRDLDERTDGHTVLVHVRRRGLGDGYEERHASWVAEQVGQTVIGPPQFC
ncbi:hypothetical protein ACFXAW_36145 [Streptomyces sp. NPDC059445]|uniref:hypothetical protein n=1 Tax=Streptomyces sp. NPDC059445 TaxID=3346832 RepID=UPI0036830A0E